jgi:uncharacterized protein
VNPLNIIAIMDGRLGHEKQTQGIIHALEKVTRLNAAYQRLPSLSLPATLRNWCAYLNTEIWKRSHHNLNEQADLVIGTGSHTHVPLLQLKKRTGAKAVTCMTPMFPLNLKIDLCFIPSHDRPRLAENIFITTGPPSTAVPKGAHNPNKGLILVGGIDNKSHRWSTANTLKQIAAIIQKAPEYHWTISSSPRTPKETLANLQELAATHPQTTFFDAKDTPRGWIEEQYNESHIAWVTGDSVSMVYEALTAGCSVGILPVKWNKQNNKFQRSINDLYSAGLAISFEKWLSGKQFFFTESPLNEADRCAFEILRRWWPERLP